jgi:hypothetical protein
MCASKAPSSGRVDIGVVCRVVASSVSFFGDANLHKVRGDPPPPPSFACPQGESGGDAANLSCIAAHCIACDPFPPETSQLSFLDFCDAVTRVADAKTAGSGLSLPLRVEAFLRRLLPAATPPELTMS